MQERLEFAKYVVRQAGEVTLRYFNTATLSVENKADESPVTIADKETEMFLRQKIAEQFPDDSIFGEEFGKIKKNGNFCWYLDPIDGTKSFIHGVPLFSTLVGITQNEVPVAGVIALPALNEIVWAGNGLGCWHEIGRGTPVRCHVSNCENLADAVFLTSEIKTFRKTRRFQVFRKLENSVKLCRTWGDAYGYVLVATGRADIMLDPQMSDWDAGPLLSVLKEAGGTFTNWKGEETIFGREGVAANPVLHQKLLAYLA